MLTIPDQYTSLELIDSITWDKIFDTWRQGEAHQESWKKHWEERDFDSWDEWRKAYAAPLNPEKLGWFLYKINEPLKEFPEIYGVPSHSWIEKAYDGKITMQLKDILNLPIIKANQKIIDIKKNFPAKTMLTGLIWQDKIILIEGMHRACALALPDLSIPLESEITIALTNWPEKNMPIIGGNYKK
ncbi:MAG: hypothetical protein WCV59_00530 [Parcubacteria group bacterium]|jgi:hypothetical protein